MIDVRGKKTENTGINHLPDDLVIDILSRLPAKDVYHCRFVCPRWRDLTSIQNRTFLDMHDKHGVPMILTVEKKNKGREEAFFLDKWWEIRRKRPVIHRFSGNNDTLFSERCLGYGTRIEFSLNGLIVSQHHSFLDSFKKIIVSNPVNGEKVEITLSKNMYHSEMRGVYFHPLLKEYCTLWTTVSKSGPDIDVEDYKVLNLGSKPCWKKIKNLKSKSSSVWTIAPVFIEKYLYRAIEVGEDRTYLNYSEVKVQLHIMEFDIIREELKMMPCPAIATFKGSDCNTNLLNIDGCLSVVRIIRRGNLFDDINIWTLKDRVGQLWDCSDYRFFFTYAYNSPLTFGFPQPICVANGELVMESDMTLFVYNLKKRTTRIAWKKKNKHRVSFFSHLMSFASLQNCTSNLYMDENGEVPMRHCPSDKECSTSTSRSCNKVIGDADDMVNEGITVAAESNSKYEGH